MTEVRSSSVVSLNHAPAGTPIVFVFPDAGTSSTAFSHFAVRAGNDYTVLGLDPPGLHPGERPFASIEEAGQDYTERIRLVARTGEVHLIGHSFGALIAFATALTLEATGSAVASLSLFDPPLPQWCAEPSLPEVRRGFAAGLWEAQSLQLPATVAKAVGATTVGFISTLHRTLPEVVEEATLAARFETFRAAQQLSYDPKTPYRGAGHIFVAFGKNDRERIAQWAGLLRGMTICVIAAGHHKMLRSDHATTLFQLWQKVRSTDLLPDDG